MKEVTIRMKKAIRIMLCLLLLAAYVPMLGIGQAQAAVGDGVITLVDDTFDDSAITVGVLPAGYSNPVGGSVIGSFTATNNTAVINNTMPTNTTYNSTLSTAIVGNSTNVLWVNDDKSGRGGFKRAFTPVTAASNQGVTAELRFMEPALVGDTTFELFDSTGKGTAVTLRLGDYTVPLGLKANIWYNLKFVADVKAGTADLYLNDKFIKNAKFTSPVADIAYFNLRMAGSSPGTAFIDDIRVYRQLAVTPQKLEALGSDKTVDLTWSPASGAETYNVYRKTGESGAYEPIATGVSGNNYTDKNGLLNNTEYYYAVTSLVTTEEGLKESDYSYPALGFPTDVLPPSAPISGFKAVLRDGQITLQWDPISGVTVYSGTKPLDIPTFYTLERSTTPDGPFVSLLSNGSTKIYEPSYLDTNLVPGMEYYYKVTAGNVGGMGNHEMLHAVTTASPLAAPALLNAAPGNNKVDLSWTAVNQATSYQVKRSLTNGGPYTLVYSGPERSYSDSTAVNGTAYYYVVSAVNDRQVNTISIQESMISNQLRAVPYTSLPGAPQKPEGLKAAAGETSVTLSWNAVPGADTYTVKRAEATTMNVPGAYAPLTVTGQTYYEDTTAAVGKVYFYTVSAANTTGAGPESDEVAGLRAKVLTVDPNAQADGTKVFNTVQSAVSTVPAANTTRTVVSIAPGTYREKVKVSSPYVSLVGSGMEVTKIVYGDYGGTSSTVGKPGHTGNTFYSQTVEVVADYFMASNLTIENDAGPRNDVAQAVALGMKSDYAVLESVKLLGYQDTLYNGLSTVSSSSSPNYKKGRQYIHNSIIAGDVDFIFGEATAVVLDHVQMVLVSNVPAGATAGGHITAGAQAVSDKGYYILNSSIVDGPSAKGTYDLGRPWKDYARVSFINTFINSKNFLPGGWVAACAGSCVQSYFSEYNSYGPGANPTARIISKQLTGAEASVTVQQIFDGWNPAVQVAMPKVQYMPEVVAQSTLFDRHPAQQSDIHTTVTSSVYGVTSITNGSYTLGAADYTVTGNVYSLKKEYLAGLNDGATELQFHFENGVVPVSVYVADSTVAELGREVLPVNDGWAAYPNGTTRGGADANEANVFTVTNRKEMVAALAGGSATPKIIYVQGTIDMNVDDNNIPVGMDYYAAPGYDFDAYLAAYDPAVWGRTNVPSGPLEAARAASAANQGNRIKLTVGSNTTIVGLPGTHAAILGGSLNLQNVDNVIIRNIEFRNTFDYFPQWDPTDGESGNWNSAYDSVSVKGSTHIWIDHNTFSDTGGSDDYSRMYFGRQYQQHDGTLDLTNASDLVTVSYNFFHDHDKTSLIGGSDSYTADAGKERITFHHNYYKDVNQRAPRVRFGQVHLYNNYYEGTYDHESYPYLYSIGVGYESQIFAENNYFRLDPSIPASAILGINGGTRFTDTGTLLNGEALDLNQVYPALQPVTWAPTLHTAVNAAADVPAIVKSQAGIWGGDKESPAWSAGQVLSVGAADQTSIRLNWNPAADNTAVAGYKVFTVTESTYYKEIAALGNVAGYSVTGLSPNTGYTFTIKAVDAAGNWSTFAPAVNAYTTGSSGGSSVPASPGKKQEVLSTTVKDATVTAVLHAEGLADVLAKLASGVKEVELAVKESGRIVKLELTADALKAVADAKSDAILNIQSENGAYKLPAKLVDLAVAAKELGVAEADLKLTVTMEKVQSAQAEEVSAAASKLGAAELSVPVEFTLSVEAKDGRKQEISSFTTYVERSFKLQGAVDPKTAAGVMYDPETKKFVPVPTRFNGSEAVMLRRGNSIYTVIQNPKSFGDLSQHWAKADVETLASKLIVAGESDTVFAPDRQITRAEFAALLVRAMGLEEKQVGSFSDVAAGAWYSGAVGAAFQAKFINGFEDGTFRPDAPITREEMVVMIVRAMELGGKVVQADTARLAKFADRSAISEWSQDAVSGSVAAGIIRGVSDSAFAPEAQATRAEATVILKRALQSMDFMNP